MPADAPVAHRFTHHAMATLFEVFVNGGESDYAGQAAQAAFAEIGRIERLFNRFDATSEIARLNRLKPGESMAVGIETYECLTLAGEVGRDSAGAFDINVRALIKYGGGAGTAPFELARTEAGIRGSARRSRGGTARAARPGPGGHRQRLRPRQGRRSPGRLERRGRAHPRRNEHGHRARRRPRRGREGLAGRRRRGMALRGSPFGPPASKPGPQRVRDRGQGEAHPRPEDRASGLRAPGGLGLPPFGLHVRCPFDRLHGHDHGRGRSVLPPPRGGMGPGRPRLRRLPGVQSGRRRGIGIE